MSVARIALGVIPFLICLWTWRVAARHTNEWRKSLGLAAVAMGLLVGVGTELLSLMDSVQLLGLLFLYALFGTGLALVSRRLADQGRPVPTFPWRRAREPIVAAGGGVCAALGLLALVAPPNNWDSMTYHMARVVHWAVNEDVSHYATHIDRQLFVQPWSEYAILHTYVLAQSDTFANCIQWAAMVVSVVLATLLARNVGLGHHGEVAAAIIVLTLPMGVTQAPTTQTDYVATLWVVVLAVVVTDRSRKTMTWQEAALVGCVVGLAGMTKATSYFFVAPLVLWWVVRRVELRPTALLKAGVVAAIPVLVLTGPGFIRNIDTFSRPLGPPQTEFINDPIGPRAVLENSYRHAALQLGVPHEAVNSKTTELVSKGADTVGLDLDRLGSTFPDGFQFVVYFGTREDDAQAFAATMLFVVGGVWLLVTWRSGRRQLHAKGLPVLVACAAVGAIGIEAYFQWNPWNSRYLLPFFVLGAVVGAALLERLPSLLRNLALVALLGSSLVWVLGSDLRPVLRSDSVLKLSREEQYFAARPELQVPYEQAAKLVSSLDVDKVGYIGGADDWEYPLWVLLRHDEGRVVALESVALTNDSRVYEQRVPPVVICTTACPAKPGDGRWTSHPFGSVTVWRKE